MYLRAYLFAALCVPSLSIIPFDVLLPLFFSFNLLPPHPPLAISESVFCERDRAPLPKDPLQCGGAQHEAMLFLPHHVLLAYLTLHLNSAAVTRLASVALPSRGGGQGSGGGEREGGGRGVCVGRRRRGVGNPSEHWGGC